MTSAEDVQKLRKATGAGIMDCKKALEEAGGDFDKAQEVIKEKGFAKAEKKSERELGSGVVESYIHNDRVGVLLLLACETDFVAKSDEFKTLAHKISMHIAAMDPESVEDLLKQDFVQDESSTVEGLITAAVAKIGENIKVEKFTRYEI